MIRAEQVRFQYKKRDVDGNVIATEEILKGVDKTEELKSIRSRIKEDQYALRAAKKGKKVWMFLL